ncbi:MAG: hypothetical protein EHM40_06475 [Chloroflexi bacterium]|nr:MAG: hypothetical protein EHM40_06475 [Chloroflexota bacterium]
MTKPEFRKREKEVIEYLLQGKSNKEIAQKLGVSVRTVEFHLSNIYLRLDVHSRTEAVIKLTQSSLEKPASRNTGRVLQESTVAKKDQRADNEGNQRQRRFPMKEILTAVIVLVSSVINIYGDTSVVIGTVTPGPMPFEMEETPPPTSTPFGWDDLPGPTPTPIGWGDLPGPTPTPFGWDDLPGPTPTPFGRDDLPGPTPTPFGRDDLPGPTPTPFGWGNDTPILMCTPPPCPGNNFACGNPNGCQGGCGTICLTPTPLGMQETPTPLPLLLLEMGETPTPIP